MIRRFLPLCGCLALCLAGCGGTPSSSQTGVSVSLGAKSLPAINPPVFVPGPLDGQSTPRALALRRPLAAIVENYDPDSRPQSGLAAASTVIETLAEGGVTRFMALYLERDSPKVGPVRSTREYFDNWAAGFHSILSHVGGNDDAQALLWHLPPVFNIDENHWEKSLFDTGTPLFWRTSDRVAPHNLYTSTLKLRAYAVQNHQDWTYAQAYLLHKAPAVPSQRAHAGFLAINFVDPLSPQPDPGYDVRYQYDRKSDSYPRFMGGVPHVDADTNTQIQPANVIVMRTGNATPDPAAGPTPDSILIPTIGSGQALYFRDGTVTPGTWHQPNRFAPLRFLDRRGRAIAFNPGQTWIEVVPASSTVSWNFH